MTTATQSKLKAGLESLRCPLTDSGSETMGTLHEALSVPASESRLRLVEWLIRKFDDQLLDKVGDTPLAVTGGAGRQPGFDQSQMQTQRPPASVSARTQSLANAAHILGICRPNDYDAVEGSMEVIVSLVELLQARMAAEDAEVVGGVFLDSQAAASVDLLLGIAGRQATVFAETASFVLPAMAQGKGKGKDRGPAPSGKGKKTKIEAEKEAAATESPDMRQLADTLRNMEWELGHVTADLETARAKESGYSDTDADAVTNAGAEEAERVRVAWAALGARTREFNAVYRDEIEPWTHINPPVPTDIGPASLPVLAKFEDIEAVVAALGRVMEAYAQLQSDGRCSSMLQAPEFGDAAVFALVECRDILQAALKRGTI